MNIKEIYKNLKTNFIPFVYVCIIQTILNFTSPMNIRWGSPYYVIFTIIETILCIIFYAHSFAYPRETVKTFELDFGVDIPNLNKVFLFFILNIAFLYVYYKNPFNIPHSLHIIYYMHFIIVYVLIFQASRNLKLKS